jgi:hypothetical protein
MDQNADSTVKSGKLEVRTSQFKGVSFVEVIKDDEIKFSALL